MRFLTISLFAFLPMTAMAGDRITVADVEAVYEYVDAALAGNSCSAESKDGAAACEIECPSHERAVCSSTTSTASCSCLIGSKPPTDREGFGAY